MASQASQNKAGVTPGKLVLIGVLAVVLVGVLYIQFGGSGAKPKPAAHASQPARSVAARRVAVKRTDQTTPEASEEDEAARQPVDAAVWAPPDLATVAAYDPFALPSRFPQAQGGKSGAGPDVGETSIDAMARARDQVEKQIAELRQRGVQVITKEAGEWVASIDGRTIHVGDEIDGLTVTEITPSGVRVERKIKE